MGLRRLANMHGLSVIFSILLSLLFCPSVSEVYDATGLSQSTYDDLGNLTQSIRTYTGLSPFTFDYTYHADGARASMNSVAGNWTYLYDKASRYTSMTSPLGTVSSEYELNGWQKKRTLPNGAHTSFGYDPAGLPNSIVHKKPDNSLISEWSEFSYDGVFNLVDVSTSGHTFNTNFNGLLGFAYTSKDQLSTESSTRFGDYVESNVWDASGNPTTFRNASGRTFNNSNQRTNTGFVYDGNGNPTTHGGTTATYDAENRMLTYGSATYTYRADGLRASDGTGSSKKYYLYDGGNAICRLDSTGTLDRTYVFAPDGLVGWSIPNSTSHQMLFDWQGNLEHSTGTTGSVATSHAYNAWGQRNSVFPINAVTGANDRYGYNARWGYVRDTTGLYYCQNRYYDPANGGWLNRDPIGYAGGMNMYGYCGGGPVGAADPTGAIFETLLDLVGVFTDAYAFAKDPSWENAGYLVWSIGATVTPGAPGSYVGRGLKMAAQGGEAATAGKRLYNGTKLARNMNAAGKGIEKGTGACHHIVAKGAEGAEGAMKLLAKWGIDIDDASNGVGLPRAFHQRVHTKNYYRSVEERLGRANDPDHARKILEQIGKDLVKQSKKRRR